MDSYLTESVDFSGMYLVGIRVAISQALLDRWFSHLEMMGQTTGETVLRGWFADQSDLFGLLAVIRDLGLPLVYVEYLGNNVDALRDCKAD